MAASFGAFRPRVRSYWDATTFYVESDNVPDNTRMPNLMVGITSWQQQIPLPTSYFAYTTNPEKDTKSIGYGKPNVWRLPLVPVPSDAPIPISAGNFQRGAIAVGADGIAIFNPRNNTGRVSYEIGELDVFHMTDFVDDTDDGRCQFLGAVRALDGDRDIGFHTTHLL